MSADDKAASDAAQATRRAGAILTVDDKGPGLRPEELDGVFRRFVRADGGNSGTGFGLGLAIAERAVRAHDGTIEASNRPGGGLRMAIILPL